MYFFFFIVIENVCGYSPYWGASNEYSHYVRNKKKTQHVFVEKKKKNTLIIITLSIGTDRPLQTV